MGRHCKYFRECKAPAVVRVPYAGLSLCKDHFLQFVEKRVERSVKRYRFLTHSEVKHERWAVAMSGGKDSQVLASIIRNQFPERVDPVGVYIDVGIAPDSYTTQSRQVVEDTCRRLDMPCVVVDVEKDYGFSMDDVHQFTRRRNPRRGKKTTRTDCSACGILKRYLLNKAAVDLGVEKIATGHHLTDEATTILGNFLSMNVDLLARGRPWAERKEVVGGPSSAVLVPRVKPLYEVAEDEIAMYAYHAGIPYMGTQCAYSPDAPSLALKKRVVDLERERPGMMLTLVRGYQKRLLPVLTAGIQALPETTRQKIQHSEEPELRACSECGNPTTGDSCAFCRLRHQVLDFKANLE